MSAIAVTTRAAVYPRSRVLAAFAAVYVVWGSTYLAIRYAVETLPPFLMSGTRFVISGTLLVAWASARGSERPSRAQWRAAAITGFLMLCWGNGSVGWAEQRLPSGIAALIVAVVPLWMVLIEWRRPGGSRPRPGVMVGVALGFVGLMLLVGPAAVGNGGGVDLVAAGVLVIAGLSWAAGSIYNRVGARPRSAAMSTGMQMLAGGVGLLLMSLVAGEPRGFSMARVSAASWVGWLYLVTFGSLVGFTAYIYLLRAVSPAKASTYAYVNPVVAVILGWAIAGEPITSRTVAAAAVIVAGVAMITVAGTQSSTARRA